MTATSTPTQEQTHRPHRVRGWIAGATVGVAALGAASVIGETRNHSHQNFKSMTGNVTFQVETAERPFDGINVLPDIRLKATTSDGKPIRVMAADSFTLRPVGHRMSDGGWEINSRNNPALNETVVFATCAGGKPDWVALRFDHTKGWSTAGPDTAISPALSAVPLQVAETRTAIPAVEAACHGGL